MTAKTFLCACEETFPVLGESPLWEAILPTQAGLKAAPARLVTIRDQASAGQFARRTGPGSGATADARLPPMHFARIVHPSGLCHAGILHSTNREDAHCAQGAAEPFVRTPWVWLVGALNKPDS